MLSKNFDRVQWATNQYYNPPTSAVRELRVPLKAGSADAYFTDDIGNVSTSRFNIAPRFAMLDIKPRYPLFGGWKYSFRIGWNGPLSAYLRKLASGDSYVLKVPFIEGPRMPEGVQYERVEVRVILPEGAQDIKYETSVDIIKAETSLHRTFMDTLGRTTLRLEALNVVDDSRETDLIVSLVTVYINLDSSWPILTASVQQVTYSYPAFAAYRKPLTIFAGLVSVFAVSWILSRIDVSIGRKSTT